ncbi:MULTISPECIES: RNA polymerase sigma-70 factor [Parabacteroides]|uniref:RNA polymerase sigma-70 factor n=1 Tax=Parabacteroides provencensis TaxID=1944636 RepID=UPI000C1449E9|nr:RNA polymerase sigma-70 factor [Parabacteroides provencensis]
MSKIRHNDIDAFLLDRIADNDEEAFSSLFSEYYADFVVFAGSFLGKREDSEEIVQEVFVELWESRNRLKRDRSLRSYLLTIIHNKCMDALRHDQIKQNYVEYIIKEDTENPYDVESSVFLSDLQYRLKEAFAKLPAELLIPFKMNRFDGKKYQEISDELGLPLRTIEFRISRALKLIRMYLKEYFIFCLLLGLI